MPTWHTTLLVIVGLIALWSQPGCDSAKGSPRTDALVDTAPTVDMGALPDGPADGNPAHDAAPADAKGDGYTPLSCGSEVSGPLFDGTAAASAAARKVETVVGGQAGYADGEAVAVRLNVPLGLARGDGEFFLSECDNHTLRRIDSSSWATTTLAGQGGERGAADGIGTAARFDCPADVVVLGGGLYVTDTWNDTIRRVDLATHEVGTLAGKAGERGWADGAGSQARFFLPAAITTDGHFLYVADSGNHVIRRVDPQSGIVRTLAGRVAERGFVDGNCAEARFSTPRGLTTDGERLYVSDAGNGAIRRLDLASGEVSTVAGGFEPDVPHRDGVGTEARFDQPAHLTTDGVNLFVADVNNHVVRQVTLADGRVSTIAGLPGFNGAVDGIGEQARLHWPAGMVLDGEQLVLVDSRNHRIRRLTLP